MKGVPIDCPISQVEKIRDLNHDQLSTYGIGKDLSVDEWTYLGRSLLQQGLLSQTVDGYPVLRLNQLSLGRSYVDSVA